MGISNPAFEVSFSYIIPKLCRGGGGRGRGGGEGAFKTSKRILENLGNVKKN